MDVEVVDTGDIVKTQGIAVASHIGAQDVDSDTSDTVGHREEEARLLHD